MNTTQRRDLADWEVENLRLSCFPIDSVEPDVSTWWSEVVSQEPDATINRPKEGRFQAEGPVGELITSPDARLLLSSEPSRIDWILSKAPGESELPSLGGFEKLSQQFLALLSEWLRTSEIAFKRIAFGAACLLPVPDHDAGYDQFSAYLPFVLDPSSSDFRYRINHPIPSESLEDHTLLNRLQSWALARYSIISFQLSVGQGPSTGKVSTTDNDPVFACRLELDVNTAADRVAALPAETLVGLLGELHREALLLAERGDRTDE